jgi:hypothetical protein
MNFKQFIESMEEQGRGEYVARYKTLGGKMFEVWLHVRPGYIGDRWSDKVASITYLHSYPRKAAGSFREVLREFKMDLDKLGIKPEDIRYTVAIDDKTGGESRERLFKGYFRG